MDRQARQAVGSGRRHESTRRGFAVAVAALAAAIVVVAPLSAQTAIKLATLVPQGSIWDKAIQQMGEEWKQATGGRVTLTVYAGGTQGDEPTVLRKMRLDALQAAAFTNVGLGTIDASFNVFNIPFFFESYDELNFVVEKLTPSIRKSLDSKGFVLLNWGHGGWAQVFTKTPVRSVDDLKKIKLYTSTGNDRMVQWFKANGFEPRPMAMTDILTGLTTGMIEGLPTPPLAALLFQWYKQTPYMLDLGLAPIIGANVISKKTWNSIPEADRPKLQEAALAVEKKLQVEVPKQDASSVEMMTKQGLTVTKATGPEWRTQLDNLAKTMRGEMVPPDVFDAALKARTEFRKQHPPAKQ